ncbi:MAG: FtsX-like permease family protein [Segetibacter sp.]
MQKDNAVVKRMLYALSFVGFFILLMAVVNFINIAISSSGNRMKEIGVRKVLGGLRSQLIFQFLAESFILVLNCNCVGIGCISFCQAFVFGNGGQIHPIALIVSR